MIKERQRHADETSWPTSTPRLKNRRAAGIAFSGRPSARRELANPSPCNRPKTNATTHGQRSASPARSMRPWTISAATNTMLSAIAASTGCGGTWTKPREGGRGERDDVGDRECGDGDDQATPGTHQQQHREHEQQMVDAEQDMLDPKAEIGGCDRAPARRILDRESGFRRGETGDLRRAVRALQAHQDVDHGGRQAAERDLAPGQPSGAADGRALDSRPACCEPARRSLERAIVGPGRRDGELQVTARRHLPEDVPGLGAGLPQLEIAGPNLMRLRAGAKPRAGARAAATPPASLTLRQRGRALAGPCGALHGHLVVRPQAVIERAVHLLLPDGAPLVRNRVPHLGEVGLARGGPLTHQDEMHPVAGTRPARTSGRRAALPLRRRMARRTAVRRRAPTAPGSPAPGETGRPPRPDRTCRY